MSEDLFDLFIYRGMCPYPQRQISTPSITPATDPLPPLSEESNLMR
ncbi:MAG TPA: hypothetical protein VF544_04590 [Pyrinomonadaceae bacterium]